MDLTSDALKFLADSGQIADFKTILDEADYTTILFKPGVGSPATIERVPKDSFQRGHKFLDLKSFLEYLRAPEPEASEGNTFPGIVFVSDTEVSADMRYGFQGRHTVKLPLTTTEEHQAIKTLFKGVTQHELWRLLQTSLYGCVSEELSLISSTVSFTCRQKSLSAISVLGITNKSGESEIVVEFPGQADKPAQQFKIPVEWEFNLRLWTALETIYTVNTRLEITDTGGFVFHPRRLQDVITKAVCDIVDEIKKAAPPSFTVHAGSI